MRSILVASALAILPLSAAAQDVEAGEKVFGKCKACHMIDDGNQVIVKGNRTGPNLWNVVGRQVGSMQDFNYGRGLQEIFGKEQIYWDESTLMAYLLDPSAWVKEVSGDKALNSKMTFKLKDEKQRADVIAYLRSLSPDAPALGAMPAAETESETEDDDGEDLEGDDD